MTAIPPSYHQSSHGTFMMVYTVIMVSMLSRLMVSGVFNGTQILSECHNVELFILNCDIDLCRFCERPNERRYTQCLYSERYVLPAPDYF